MSQLSLERRMALYMPQQLTYELLLIDGLCHTGHDTGYPAEGFTGV